MKTPNYEQYLNIETEGYQQGFPKDLQYHRYEPTPYKALDTIFQHYELPKEAVCVDIGCGKGRVPIYMYDQFHIKSRGIEMDPKFFAAAQYNLIQYAKKHHVKANYIQFFEMKAEDYEIKEDENVFFFFNPFSINIFRKVYYLILQSKLLVPRDIHLLFYYPSPEYMEFLFNQTELEHMKDLKLADEHNENERIVIFKM